MLHATLLLGFERFGARVLDRVLYGLPAEEPLLRALRGEDLHARLPTVLEELLRAGQAARPAREARLDVMLFAAALQCGEDDLADQILRLGELVHRRFGAIFPSDRPPEQRGAALHLVLALPALGPGEATEEALRRLERIESALGDPLAASLLSRVWCVSQQSAAGTLSHDELVASCAALATATLASGLRDADPVVERSAHLPGSEGRFAFFASASLELPEARLAAYARHRAALDTLSTLLRRVQRHEGAEVPSLGEREATLGHRRWLDPFEDDAELPRRLRRLAASLNGPAAALPERPELGRFDDGPRLRARHPVLFLPATEERAPGSKDEQEMASLGAAMDQVEHEILEGADRDLEVLFEESAGSEIGFRGLSSLDEALSRVAAEIRDQERRIPGPEASRASASLGDPDPWREELEQAADTLPSRVRLLATGLAAASGPALLTLGLVLTWQLSADAPLAPDPLATPAFAWLAALAVGLLVALVWVLAAGHRVREHARELLGRRARALAELRARGGAGRLARRADALLYWRRRRVCRGLRLLVEKVRARTDGIRHALLAARERERGALAALGVQAREEPGKDVLDDLLGELGPLHGALLGREHVWPWIERLGAMGEVELRADRLARTCWPPGLTRRDRPLPGGEALVREALRLVDASVAAGAASGVLDDPEVLREASRTLDAFLPRVESALAAPCVPRDPHGSPTHGLRPGETLVVAPLLARDAFIALRERRGARASVLWSASRAARVLLLRTWEGFRLEDIARGIQRAGEASLR